MPNCMEVFLVSSGASLDFDARNADGHTPMEVAVGRASTPCLELLKQNISHPPGLAKKASTQIKPFPILACRPNRLSETMFASDDRIPV